MSLSALRAIPILGRSVASDTWASAWLMSAGALVIGVGSASPNPSAATSIAILACVLAGIALLGPGRLLARTIRQHSVVTVLVAGLLLELFANVVTPPVDDPAYLLALVAAGITGIVAMLFHRWNFPVLFVALAAQFALAALMIGTLEVPDIDVHMFQQEGAAALLAGDNPYSLRYRNTAGFGTGIYAPELQVGDRLAFGFPYPPASLFMALPGYLLAGDYRYGAAGAVLVTALVTSRLRPGAVASGAALLFAFSPLTFRVLYYGWTEPFVGAWLALTLLAATKLARGAPISLGLLVAMKQYVLPVALLAPLLLVDLTRRIGWPRLVGIAVATAGVTILPFLLWNAGDVLFSVVAVQALQPLRLDSASIPGGLARMGFAIPPQWLAFVVAACAAALVAFRAPRTPAGFSAAVAFTFIAFFLFSKQAFGNYYFFPLAALVCATALSAPSGPQDRPRCG